jgi:ATP-binding cassette, subfamily B, bacterial
MRDYRPLFKYIARQRARFLLITLMTILASALAVVQPWPMKVVVDYVLQQVPMPGWLKSFCSAFPIASTRSGLVGVAALSGLLLFGLSSAIETALTWAWTMAGRRMVYDLAEDLFARLQRRSVLFHTRAAVGDSMSRITGDSWCVYQLSDALFFAPFHAVLTTAGVIVLMIQLDRTMTLAAVLIAPAVIFASLLAGKRLRAAALAKREIESRMQVQVQQTLTGIPVVQAFAQEQRETERFARYADAAIRAQQRSAIVGSLNTLTSGFAATLGTGLILWLGANHVLSHKLSVGSLMVFLAYVVLLQAQFKTLANVYTSVQGLHANVSRVIEVLDAKPDLAEKPGAKSLERANGLVQLEHVWFAYETDNHPVLRDLSIEIQPGECVALAGASGSGKSTLAGLIPRFFDPQKGAVKLDQTDLRDFRLSDVRRQVAMVFQEPFLLAGSIADNIAYGRPDASRAEIEAAADAAQAHAFIKHLPQRYETILGERGVTLSGGERQRIAIARAFLKNAPILILDEPTSALDYRTEQGIMQTLQELMRNRTTLLIAHRLSTVRHAHRILVLRAGQIVEAGTHDELLVRRGDYARMYQVQSAPRPQPA